MSGAVVCTPLRCEQAALAGAVAVPVRRSGRGPSGCLDAAGSVDATGPVLVAGVAGSLTDGLRPGDVVVASEFRTADTVLASPAAPLLPQALRRCGLSVHVGPVLSRGHVPNGRRRADASASGALAVDTESAYLARQALAGQAVAVCAIVDTPSAPLWRPGTVARGVTALRALRAAAPALNEWAAATGAREVLLAGPRSFCAGVERAVATVERALARFGAPVYVRRQIVHSQAVVADLARRGAVFVDELDEIPPGATVILAAHGVAPSVHRDAAARGLRVIDATCPLVAKVHSEVRRFATKGHTVFLIGHSEHDEVIGTRGEAPEAVVVVGDPAQAARVGAPDPEKVAYVMQTTLAADEAERTAAVLRERFPALAEPGRDDICYATTNRQAAVREIARHSDLVLVLGSANSSNSQRLVEVAERCGVSAHLVEDATAVDLRWLPEVRRVGVTAGASAPPHLVDEMVRCLSGLGTTTVREVTAVDEDVRFTMPKEVS